MERVAVGVQRNVALGNVMKVLKMRVDGIQHLRVGETTVRLDKRTQGLARALKLVFQDAIPQLAIAIPAVILSFIESYIAGLVILAVLLLNAAVTSVQVKSQKGIRIALFNKAASLAGQVSELLSHLDFVRASGMASHVERCFRLKRLQT